MLHFLAIEILITDSYINIFGKDFRTVSSNFPEYPHFSLKVNLEYRNSEIWNLYFLTNSKSPEKFHQSDCKHYRPIALGQYNSKRKFLAA